MCLDAMTPFIPAAGGFDQTERSLYFLSNGDPVLAKTTLDTRWQVTGDEVESCYVLIRIDDDLAFFGEDKRSTFWLCGDMSDGFELIENNIKYDCTSATEPFTSDKAEAFRALDRFDMAVRTMIDDGEDPQDLKRVFDFIDSLNFWMGRDIEKCETDEDGYQYCKRGKVSECLEGQECRVAGSVETDWLLSH